MIAMAWLTSAPETLILGWPSLRRTKVGSDWTRYLSAMERSVVGKVGRRVVRKWWYEETWGLSRRLS